MTIFSIYQTNLTNYIFGSTVCPMWVTDGTRRPVGHPSVRHRQYASTC